MDIDPEKGIIQLDPVDLAALGVPPSVTSEQPLSAAQFILEQAEAAQRQINAYDTSYLPLGASKNQIQGSLGRNSKTLDSIIKQLRPFLPEVSAGAEAFLRDLA